MKAKIYPLPKGFEERLLIHCRDNVFPRDESENRYLAAIAAIEAIREGKPDRWIEDTWKNSSNPWKDPSRTLTAQEVVEDLRLSDFLAELGIE